jgi:hypothetical protein
MYLLLCVLLKIGLHSVLKQSRGEMGQMRRRKREEEENNKGLDLKIIETKRFHFNIFIAIYIHIR